MDPVEALEELAEAVEQIQNGEELDEEELATVALNLRELRAYFRLGNEGGSERERSSNSSGGSRRESFGASILGRGRKG